MKVKFYERYEDAYKGLDHPEDMRRIMDYLNERGKVLVSVRAVEGAYYVYSEKRACGWRIVDDESLADFEEWLASLEA